MIDIFLAVVSITALFALFVFLREISWFKVCALCAGVSLTWLFMLLYLYLGGSVDMTLLALLVGGSIVGLMYLLEEKLPEKYKIFKLPFFLSLLTLAYLFLEKVVSYKTIIFLGITWVFFGILFVNTNSGNLKKLSKKIIECCKNW